MAQAISIGYGDGATFVSNTVDARFVVDADEETGELTMISTCTDPRIWSYLWEIFDTDNVLVYSAEVLAVDGGSVHRHTPARGLYRVKQTITSKAKSEGSIFIDDVGEHEQPSWRLALAPVLTVVILSPTSVHITATPPSAENADDVLLEEKLGAGAYAQVDTEVVDTDGSAEFTVTGLTPGAVYSWRAQSSLDSGFDPAVGALSAYSAEETVTMPTASTPGIPTGLTDTEIARDADTITYDFEFDARPVDADSTDWWVEPSTDGGYQNASQLAPNNTTDASVLGLAITRQAENDETVFCIAHRNENGQGAILRRPISIVGNLRAPVLNQVIVSGPDLDVYYTEDADADSADEYDVEKDSTGAGFSVVSTEAPGAAAPQHSEVGLPVGTHQIRVRARDLGPPVRESLYSVIKSGIIGAPAPTGYNAGCDFRTLNSLNDLPAGFSVVNTGNITYDPGTDILAHTGQPSGYRGLKYHFIQKDVCKNGNSLTTLLNYLGGRRIHIDCEAVFSSNWRNDHPVLGCSNGDYKFILNYLKPASASLPAGRADLRIGTNDTRIALTGMGGVTLNTGVPKAVWGATSPISPFALYDDLPHRYQLSEELVFEDGVWKDVLKLKIDGVQTHSFKGFTNGDVGAGVYKQLKLGANRNIGAWESMYLHWLQFYLWDDRGVPSWYDEFQAMEIEDYT